MTDEEICRRYSDAGLESLVYSLSRNPSAWPERLRAAKAEIHRRRMDAKAEEERVVSQEGWMREKSELTLTNAAKCYYDTAKYQINQECGKVPAGFINKLNAPEWFNPSEYPVNNLEKAGEIYRELADRNAIKGFLCIAENMLSMANVCSRFIAQKEKEGA